MDKAEAYLKEINPDYVTESEQMEREKQERERQEAEQIEQARTNSKKGCFIATAVYGDYEAPEVVELRKFRDNVLEKNAFGRLFIKLYYKISPPFATWLKAHSSISKIIKNVLDIFVGKIK